MKTKKEIIDYLTEWFRFVDMQDIPEDKKKFLKKHPSLAPKGWARELERLEKTNNAQ